ncbi:MAG: alpha/beta hydrolase [Aureibaculum sp.]|nr:alpha/beta hydrolase [Aureibaculum sp.]
MTHNFKINIFKKSPKSTLKIKSVISTILKYLRVIYVAITLVIIALAFWVYQAYLSGPYAFNLNEYHPFRSEIAKKEYLEYYDAKAKEWPLDSEERLLSTSHGQTFVRISGPKDAPPLVLLPGGGRSSLMWSNQIEALSENYRTYAVDDIYDWGRSVYTKSLSCPESITKWLDELFTALELGDSINLVGYSYGGWKAGQYVLEHPNRLNKVVLLSPALTVYNPNKEFVKRVFRGFIPHRYFMKKELYWVCENLVQTEKGRAIADELLDANMLSISCFKTKMPASMTVLSDEELRSIKVQLMYMDGVNNKMLSSKKAVERLKSIAPDITTEVIPNSGHGLVFTHPKIVSKKILDFLNN